VRQLRIEPLALFEDSIESAEELEEFALTSDPVDELADLDDGGGHNVEQSVTRLARVARAVGHAPGAGHPAAQRGRHHRPHQGEFPPGSSFRVATRVDSRTVLDVMGASTCWARGDMLHLPPAPRASPACTPHSSRETEIKPRGGFLARPGHAD